MSEPARRSGPTRHLPPPPAVALCSVCGRTPATDLSFREQQGMVVFGIVRDHSGIYCRTCGLAVGRRAQERSLLLGWRGFISAWTNWLTLRDNGRELRSANTLDELLANDGSQEPLDPGQPVTRCWPVVFAAFVPLFWFALPAWMASTG